MKAKQPVILSALKDPAAGTRRLSFWMLRSVQHDKRGLVFILCLLFSALSLPIRAGEPLDLAGDLGYLRVHSLVLERETVAAALAAPRALVLDLRYPLDERGAGEMLRGQLAGRPVKTRLFVLVSPATPVPVVGAVAAHAAGLITLGVKGARPEPQVTVLQTADDDRRAYDALTQGRPLAELLSGKIDKARYDEASLLEEFRNGNPDPQPPAPAQVQAPGATPPGGPAADPPARLTDRVLQRALHLHRALQALKRG